MTGNDFESPSIKMLVLNVDRGSSWDKCIKSPRDESPNNEASTVKSTGIAKAEGCGDISGTAQFVSFNSLSMALS
jgi:hypothetical protein